MIRAFRSEWILLNRKKLWLILGAVTAVYTAVATALVINTAEPLLQQSEGGLALETLVGAGGATMAVIFSIAFAFILVLATFASSTGNEFARGTLRSALTFHSNRMSLIAGKLAARVLVAAIVMAEALVIGSITAAIVAPAQDISTNGWFGLAALGEGVEDYLRSIVYVVGFAVIGTTIAVLLRSTPSPSASACCGSVPSRTSSARDRRGRNAGSPEWCCGPSSSRKPPTRSQPRQHWRHSAPISPSAPR